jgi:hypothetical protein
MSAAVDRLLDKREQQGHPRHVEDDAALAIVAAVIGQNMKNPGCRGRGSSSPTDADLHAERHG